MFRNITPGSWITIFIVFINLIFSAGIIYNSVLNAQERANMAFKMANSNDKKIAVIETKIEQGFSNIEKLIKNGH